MFTLFCIIIIHMFTLLCIIIHVSTLDYGSFTYSHYSSYVIKKNLFYCAEN